MEQDIKTLPVSTDSRSKGYITYDPKKIDIFPLSVQVKNESLELTLASPNYLYVKFVKYKNDPKTWFS